MTITNNLICKELAHLQLEGYFCVTHHAYDISNVSEGVMPIIGEEHDTVHVHEACPPREAVHKGIHGSPTHYLTIRLPERHPHGKVGA